MTIIDDKNLLTGEQKKLLQESASLEFQLGGYTSLADILNKLDVKVHIVSGIVKRSTTYLEAAKEYWGKRLESQKESEIACKNLQVIYAELLAASCECLRGCYIPNQKKILLFPEEMITEYEGERMNELLVSTLAHETMHAYFNRPGHGCYPYVYFVEEPLAEFGMLVFLKETGITYFGRAHDDVEKKRTFYHYGALLYDKYSSGDRGLRNYLEEYKIGIDEYFIPDEVGGGVSLPALTRSPRRSTSPISPYKIFLGKVYTLMFEKSNIDHKKMIFNPKQGFWTAPTHVVQRHSSLFSSLHGNTLDLNIVDSSFSSSLAKGEAGIEHWVKNDAYAIRLDKDIRPIFQNKFRLLEPDGKLLEVAFYKNVSNDFDWILMVK